MRFIDNHLYARPGSRVFHKVVADADERPRFKCDFNQQIHDLMSTVLAEMIGSTKDLYGQRRCRRCFP